MNPEQKGHEAKLLLDSPLLNEALDTIESAIIDQWVVTNDSELRGELWYTLQGLKRFETMLTNMVQAGEDELAIKEKFNE